MGVTAEMAPERPAQFVKWYFTRRCDLGCSFCHNAKDRQRWDSDATGARVLAVARNLQRSSKVAGLTFLGGEPTTSDHLAPACAALEGATFKFGIVSAGHRLDPVALPEVYENPNLGFLGFSLDSLRSDVVKRIRGRAILESQEGNLRKAIEFRARTSSKYQIYINIILTRVNAGEMPDILDYLCDIGVSKVKILSYNTRDKGMSAAESLQLSVNEQHEVAHALGRNHAEKANTWQTAGFDVEYNFLSALAKDYYNRAFSYGLPERGHLCPISRSTVFLGNDGMLYACEELKPFFGTASERLQGDHPIADLAEVPFDSAIEKFYLRHTFARVMSSRLYENMEPCNECPHLFSRCVPCGLQGMGTDRVVVNEHCAMYRDLMNAKGLYEPRAELPMYRREPMRK